MTLEKFIPLFREYLTTHKISDDEIIDKADSVSKEVSNFVDYIVYWRGMVKTSVIEEAGKKVPKLLSIVKELHIKY